MVVAAGLATDIREVAEALRSAERLTAICHENPDADTVGAAIAIALIGERLGKPVELVSSDGIPPAFAFLPKHDEFRRRPVGSPDIVVVCDAASLERVGGLLSESREWLAAARIVNIDHHVSNERFGAVNLVDTGAAATCQVIAELLPVLGIQRDRELATALMTGIVRDSHGFSDTSTSSRTLRVAADLIDAGAPLASVSRQVLYEVPYPTMALWGRLLASLESTLDGRAVFTVLTQAMLDETGTRQHDADGVVELMGKVRGADVAFLLRELGPSETRVSIRTTEAIDATEIAADVGGGGHARRAGATVQRPWPDVLEQLIATIGTAVSFRPG